MDHLTEEDIIWLAGLLSGRGSFIRSKPTKSGKEYPIVLFTTTEGTLSLEVCKMLKVKHNKRAGRGAFASVTYEVRLAGDGARALMRRLLPYLKGHKQWQVERQLESYDRYDAMGL